MRRSWVFIAFSLFVATANAEVNEYAIELEIAPLFIGPLTHLFDLNAITRPEIDPARLPTSAPILDRHHLKGLPEGLQRNLTDGVDLSAVSEFRLLDPKDTKVETTPLIIGQKPTGLLGANGLPVAKRQGMEIVQQRWEDAWKKMSPQERAIAIPLGLLPTADRVQLVMRALPNRWLKEKPIPPLRSDLSPELAKLLENTRWEIDQSQFEIKDTSPTRDRGALVAKWKRIAALCNIPNVLTNPDGNDTRSGFHLNVSRKLPQGESLYPLVSLFNVRQVAKAVAAGRPDRVFGADSSIRYTDDIGDRGLVRAKRPDFFEVRVHAEDLESEIAYLDQKLNLSPASALREMADEIVGILSVEDLRTIAHNSPKAFYDLLKQTESTATPEKIKFRIRDPKMLDLLVEGVNGKQPQNLSDIYESIRELDGATQTEFARKLHQKLNPATLKKLAETLDISDLFFLLRNTAQDATPHAKYKPESPEVVEAVVKAKLQSGTHYDIWDLVRSVTGVPPNQSLNIYLEEKVTPEEWQKAIDGPEEVDSHIGDYLATLLFSEKSQIDRDYFAKMITVLSSPKIVSRVAPFIRDEVGKKELSVEKKAAIIAIADQIPSVRLQALAFYFDRGTPARLKGMVRDHMPRWENELAELVQSLENAPVIQSQLRTEIESILGHPLRDCPLGGL